MEEAIEKKRGEIRKTSFLIICIENSFLWILKRGLFCEYIDKEPKNKYLLDTHSQSVKVW